MPDYAAFISYSHASDHATVQAFQQVVQTLGKRWWARRALTLFRDDTHLSATPELWPSIEAGLEASRAFILLATPKAAESPWVQQEVDWWLANRGPERMYLVVLDGTLDWDRTAGRFTEGSDACPPALRGAFAHEPKSIDLRAYRGRSRRDLVRDPEFQSCAGDIAAALHGRPKVDLMGEEVRQQRQLVRVFAALGVVLLAALGAAGWLYREAEQQRASAVLSQQQAERERIAAIEQSQIALQNQRNASAALAMSRATSNPLEAIRLVLSAWPDQGANFPNSELAFDALSSAISNLLPHFALSGHLGEPLSVAYSPGGESILAADSEGYVYLWDSVTGELKSSTRFAVPLRGQKFYSVRISLSPSGAAIAIIFDDGITMLELPTLSAIWGRQLSGIFCLDYSADGDIVATGHGDSGISIWNAGSGELLAQLRRSGRGSHWDLVQEVAISPDGNIVVSGSGNGEVLSWDWRGESLIASSLVSHRPGIHALQFVSDSQLIVADSHGSLFVLEAATLQVLSDTLVGTDSEAAVAVSDNRAFAVTGGFEGSINVWSAGSRLLHRSRVRSASGGVLDVAISPDNRRVVSVGRDGVVRVWSVVASASFPEPEEGSVFVQQLMPSRGGLRQVFPTPPERQADSFADDEVRFVVGDGVGTISVRNSRNGLLLYQIELGSRRPVVAAFIHPSEDILIVAQSDARVSQWELNSGGPVNALIIGNHDDLSQISLSPDGSMIALAQYSNYEASGDDPTLQVFRLSGEEIGLNSFGCRMTTSVAFSHDGRRIMSVCNYREVFLWDIETASFLARVSTWVEGQISDAVFSRDDAEIFIRLDDGRHFRFSNLPPGNILQVACRYLPHVNGRPDTNTDGLAQEFGLTNLTLPDNCDTYDPPLPPLTPAR